MDLYFEVQCFVLCLVLMSGNICGNPSYRDHSFEANTNNDVKKTHSVNRILDVAKNSILRLRQGKKQSSFSSYLQFF